jgi:hypothetical protein
MAESFVQVPADGVGKQVDTFTVTTSSGTTQHRQAVVIGDPTLAGSAVSVENGALVVDDMPSAEGEEGDDLLKLILVELRIQTFLLASEFRCRDDVEKMRNNMASIFNS